MLNWYECLDIFKNQVKHLICKGFSNTSVQEELVGVLLMLVYFFFKG